MKKEIWLPISIALNIVLLGVVVFVVGTRGGAGGAGATSATVTTGATRTRSGGAEGGGFFASLFHSGETATSPSARPTAKRQALQPGETPGKVEIDPGRAMKFSPAFGELVKQLRESGVSDATLASLVGGEFSRQWMDKRADVERQFRAGAMDEKQRQAFYAQLDVERENTMKSALGEDAYRQWDQQNVLRRLGVDALGLGPDQADALYAVQKDWQQQSRDLSRAYQAGDLDPTDYRTQNDAARQQYEAQLKETLGADGFALYQRNNDWAFGELRRDLHAMNLPDDQLVAIDSANKQLAARQKELEQANQSGQIAGKDYNVQTREAQAARDQQLQALLGQQGYADFRMYQDSGYKQMSQYASAWQLTPQDMAYVYQTLQSHQQAVQDVRNSVTAVSNPGQPAPRQQIHQNIEALNQQTDQALQTYLGADRYSKLTRAGLIKLK